MELAGNALNGDMVTNCVYLLAVDSDGPLALFRTAATCRQLFATTEDVSEERCYAIDRNRFSLSHKWRRVLCHGWPLLQLASQLTGHTGTVRSVVPLADGRIVSCSHDKSIRIWDVATSECTAVLTGHTDTVMSVVPLADGRIVS